MFSSVYSTALGCRVDEEFGKNGLGRQEAKGHPNQGGSGNLNRGALQFSG